MADIKPRTIVSIGLLFCMAAMCLPFAGLRGAHPEDGLPWLSVPVIVYGGRRVFGAVRALAGVGCVGAMIYLLALSSASSALLVIPLSVFLVVFTVRIESVFVMLLSVETLVVCTTYMPHARYGLYTLAVGGVLMFVGAFAWMREDIGKAKLDVLRLPRASLA